MREAARLPRAVAGLVHAVRYEGDHPGLPWIVIDFRDQAHYRVRPGRDARSLVVLVETGRGGHGETSPSPDAHGDSVD